MQSATSELLDYKEIDRRLEADLKRPLIDKEDLTTDSDLEAAEDKEREGIAGRE